LVVTWADEHDLFIANLKSIEAKQDYATKKRRIIEKLFDNDGFLKWSGKIVPYEINKNNNIDRTAREQAKERLNISYLDLGLTKAQGYKRQGAWGGKLGRKIANKLKNRCKQMVGVAREDIMVTCRKDLWFDQNNEISSFAKDARLAKANWVHKSTKGTNAYRNCTHAVHIFDLNLNPSVKKFLDVSKEDEDLWKQSEMIQWLYKRWS